MSLLRFDPSGSIDPNHGVSTEQLTTLLQRLGRLRSDLIRDADRASGDVDAESPCGFHETNGTDFDWRFLDLPKQQLDEYVKRRQESPLGRVFQLANGLHDKLDAVVVVASGVASSGPRAVMQACCDPYHNELTRAARGSKPRLYFEANRFDNDDVSALLHRLSQGGYGESKAERRLAVVVVFPSGDVRETIGAVDQFVSALGDSLELCGSEKVNRLIIPVASVNSKGAVVAADLDGERVFDIPIGLDEPVSVLSPAGLLPAAFLGLDCMKLLEGAVAMNEHFRTSPDAENMVTHFVATNHLLSNQRNRKGRIFCVWNRSLEALGRWYENLVARYLRDDERSISPRTVVCPRDLNGTGHENHRTRKEGVCHHVVVQDCRSDLRAVKNTDYVGEASGDTAELTMQDIQRRNVEQVQRCQRDAGIPTTRIVLPHLDTYMIGQLLQMLMISTVMEARLGDSKSATRDSCGADQSRINKTGDHDYSDAGNAQP